MVSGGLVSARSSLLGSEQAVRNKRSRREKRGYLNTEMV